MDKEKIIDFLKRLSKTIKINFNSINPIISHPLTYCLAVLKNGETLTLNKNNFEEYVNWRCEEIKEQSKDADDIFNQVHKPYRLTLLHLTKDFLTKEEFNSILKDCWVMTEYPSQNNQWMLLKLFEKSTKELLMTKEEMDKFNSLSQTIIIYRGLQGPKAKIKSLSWTLSKEKAKWFSELSGNEVKVYQAEINKENVFMYTNDRKEEEVVVNPTKLNKIKKCMDFDN